MHFWTDIRFLKPYPIYNTQMTFTITTEDDLINKLRTYIYPENLCVQHWTLTFLPGGMRHREARTTLQSLLSGKYDHSGFPP